MKRLLTHKLKEAIRSKVLTQSIVATIVIFFLIAYLAGIVIFLSLNGDMLINKMYLGQDILSVFTGFMFYYFVYDLLLRFLSQEIPSLKVKPYLSLAIKKSKLINYALASSLLSVFNLLGALLIFPFFIKSIWGAYSVRASVVWLLTMLLLIGVNNFLTLWLKRTFVKQPLLIIAMLVLFVLSTVLEIFWQLPLSVKFSNLIIEVINAPYYVIVPFALVAILYGVAYKSISNSAYIEDNANKRQQDRALQFSFLKQFGELGSLLSLEFKLIMRNKRPRSFLLLSVIFLLYGFMFYKGPNMNSHYMLLFAGLFMTSIFTLNYGQFLFSWESSYFDFLNTNNLGLKKYLESKYVLFTSVSVLTYCLTLPYAFIDSKIAIINTTLIIYNIGFSNMLMIALATFNSSAIDLGRSQMLNYQGMGAIQYLKYILLFGIPALIIYLFSFTNHPMWAFAFLALTGIVCLIYRNYFFDRIIQLLKKRKCKMLVGFRQG